MPQHSTLADAELHYCKHITTATTADSGKIITSSSTTNGISTYRKLTEADINYTDKTKNVCGWNDIADSQYTSGAPRAIVATTRTQITNNGLAVQSDTSRLGGIWVAGSSWLLINDLNAAYQLRVNFKVTAAAAAGTPYTIRLEIESATGPLVIAEQTQTIKGGGYVNGISIVEPFYMGSTINNAALKVFITPDTAVNTYDFGFFIQRHYKES